MSTTIMFKSKIVHDGKDYLAIEVDEPTVGAIEAFENAQLAKESDTTATIKMLAIDTGMPEDAIRKIKTSDFVKISEALAPFVSAAAPGTGDTGGSSPQTSPTS